MNDTIVLKHFQEFKKQLQTEYADTSRLEKFVQVVKATDEDYDKSDFLKFGNAFAVPRDLFYSQTPIYYYETGLSIAREEEGYVIDQILKSKTPDEIKLEKGSLDQVLLGKVFDVNNNTVLISSNLFDKLNNVEYRNGDWVLRISSHLIPVIIISSTKFENLFLVIDKKFGEVHYKDKNRETKRLQIEFEARPNDFRLTFYTVIKLFIQNNELVKVYKIK